MRGAEVRGFIAVALVIVAIVVAWTRIENHDVTAGNGLAQSTTTTTTTTVPPPTTTNREQALGAICTRSEDLLVQLYVAGGGTEATVARLMLEYWTDMLDLVTSDVRVEVVAIVDYYTRYLKVGEPFDFDTERIIVEGDKERWQQLVTRPAAGLEETRNLVGYLCGIELPDQFRIDAREFERLEDRLLDDE